MQLNNEFFNNLYNNMCVSIQIRSPGLIIHLSQLLQLIKLNNVYTGNNIDHDT